ncbi:MAG TPA: efflux transporter outer membrane subunit [Burkholderiales bacterium]|nr:efflux transporter outer membrane subunit [Burkholderiales bacterium]
MTRFRYAAATLAAATVGCNLTPPYERPAAPVAATFPGETAAASGRRAVDIAWREFFSDERLRRIIELALQNNRDLRVAVLRIEEARGLYRIQAADLLPAVSGAASVSRTGGAVDSTQYQVGVGVAAYELDVFGRVRNLTGASLAQYLAVGETQRTLQLGLVSQVAKSYLAERGFAEQLELARRALATREKSLELTRQRFDAGASSALELRQAQSLVEAARASVASLSRQQAQAMNALVLLAGTPLADLPPARPLGAQLLAADIGAGLPSDLLLSRPDIRAAEQRLIASNANIGAARAAFFPRISLTASLGTASGELSGLFGAGTGVWSFVPQLVLPIFTAGANQANLDVAEARKNIAVAQYEQAIQIAFREVADALAARDAVGQELAAQTRLRDAERERVKLTEQLYKGGVAGSLDYLDAQRQLFAAEQGMVQAQVLRDTSAVDLYSALGGGLK